MLVQRIRPFDGHRSLNRQRLSSQTLRSIRPLCGVVVWERDNNTLSWVDFSALESRPMVLQGFWTCAGDDVEVVAQQSLEVFPRSVIPARDFLPHAARAQIIECAED